MSYKIEKGIAVPGSVRNSFPFDKMEVGDSFYEEEIMKIGSLKVAATYYNKKHRNKKRLSVLKDGKGYRCFRIK